MKTPRDWLDAIGIVGPREREICQLLLDFYRPIDIATKCEISLRTVKAHFNRLFLRFGIVDGIKIVKLAVLLYRARRRFSANGQTNA